MDGVKGHYGLHSEVQALQEKVKVVSLAKLVNVRSNFRLCFGFLKKDFPT